MRCHNKRMYTLCYIWFMNLPEDIRTCDLCGLDQPIQGDAYEELVVVLIGISWNYW